MGTNDWILLTLSALLLIPPTFYGKAYRQTLQRRNRLRIPLSDIAEPSEIDGESSIRRTFSLPCNWFAAVRAALGAYLLIQQWPQILGEEAAKEFPYQWIALAVITVGLVVQTILYVGRSDRPRGSRTRLMLVNPLAYYSGILLTALDPIQAGIVLAAAWTIAFTINRIQLVAPLLALLVGVTTYLISGVEIFEFALAALAMAPTLLAIMNGRRAVQLI